MQTKNLLNKTDHRISGIRFNTKNHLCSLCSFVGPLRLLPLLFLASTALAAAPTPDPALTLWYDKPAAKPDMASPLPIGNGRLGAMICGDPDDEHLLLNESSLWTGDLNPSGDDKKLGSYQQLANLHILLPDHKTFTDYRRDLDIHDALAHVTYTANGIHYTREIFASHPANLIILRLTADKPAAYTGTIDLADAHKAPTTATNDQLTIAAALPNNLHYQTTLLATNDGGSLQSDATHLTFANCNSLTLFIAARTDYAENYADHYRGPNPAGPVAADLANAEKSYNTLLTDHLLDYHSLFDRLSLTLGTASPAQRALPTAPRRRESATTPDPELEALFFQFGRYLLISSSRQLPANLQGLWSTTNSPPWHSDYHTNINIEMNYWPAGVTNLSDLQLPLFTLIESQLPAWRQLTHDSPEMNTIDNQPTTRGFALRTSHNIFGGMSWKWDKTANAWYCHHFFDHYLFTQDKSFLEKSAYPIMKETCQFWIDHLNKLPDGTLVVPDAWSPEHGPVEDGVSYSQEIVWDLFDNFVHAADILQTDKQFRDTIADMRDHLATPGIGSWGQLLEWMHEGHNPKYPELDTPNDHHRHTSHLFAVYPGHQITLEKTPKLAEAAKVSLAARANAGDVREWSFAWRSILWAHLGDPEMAHAQFLEVLAKHTCPNLFGQYPPMQIDGNFGCTAAVAEMLLQSDADSISLLPALPKVWPAGTVRGLRARGNFTVDMTWSDNELDSTTIHGASGAKFTVRFHNVPAEYEIGPDGTCSIFDVHEKQAVTTTHPQ
ncbi:MAG: glycoside hydrolase family 95 protein [Phycisphaerae bacterium]